MKKEIYKPKNTEVAAYQPEARGEVWNSLPHHPADTLILNF